MKKITNIIAISILALLNVYAIVSCFAYLWILKSLSVFVLGEIVIVLFLSVVAFIYLQLLNKGIINRIGILIFAITPILIIIINPFGHFGDMLYLNSNESKYMELINRMKNSNIKKISTFSRYYKQVNNCHGNKEEDVYECTDSLGIKRNTIKELVGLIDKANLFEVEQFDNMIYLGIDGFVPSGEFGMIYSEKPILKTEIEVGSNGKYRISKIKTGWYYASN